MCWGCIGLLKVGSSCLCVILPKRIETNAGHSLAELGAGFAPAVSVVQHYRQGFDFELNKKLFTIGANKKTKKQSSQ